MSTTHHPGTIVFAEAGKKEEQVKQASEVPESIAFVKEQGVLVPVVRVVAAVVGDQRVITSFGADGRLLQTTYQRRG
ncbi:MAG: hypothetical protein Q8L48_29795 [Archangium sp.]|nr:hypothetical protein [Archangium sp.]